MQEPQLRSGKVLVYTVPTDAPEADGTFAWDSTTMVLVTLEAGDRRGIGYTYADASTGMLVKSLLEKVVDGRSAFDHGSILQDMYRQVRNSAETGMSSMAISAIDNALWDLRARLLDIPLVSLLGSFRAGIPVYGSGGFTSYNDKQLTEQLGGWAKQGFSMVKMKVGTHPDDDARRVRVARGAIGDSTRLFVDANGAIFVGRGALACREEVSQLAKTVGGPVIKALLGKAVLPDRSPYTTGGLGLLGTAPSVDAMEEYDTKRKRLIGNFPQAFSHIALVQAAMRLAGCK